MNIMFMFYEHRSWVTSGKCAHFMLHPLFLIFVFIIDFIPTLDIFSALQSLERKGPFITYARVPREGGGLEKSLHTLTLGRREVKPVHT